MNKNSLSVSIIIFSVMVSGIIVGSAMAQTQTALQPQDQKMPGDIQYPVPELGNCKSKEDCKVFCDDAKNASVCLKFAEDRNLLSPEEMANAKKFQDAGMVGPGGCKGQIECDAYCGIQSHMEECITFAIKNGMMDLQEQEESQKVLAAIKRGVKPPACNGPQECDTYCSSATHMEECMNFSIEAGIMDSQKQEEAKKVLSALKRGVKPPACNGPQECDAYCGTHMEECMTFSLEAGLAPESEKAQMQKTLNALKQGIKPPACQPNQQNQQNQSNRGNQSGLPTCDQYCADSSHIEECVKFSVATGNMSEEQAQMAMKTGGKGPGGCVGRDACDAFCNNPDNQETCFSFAKDNGMIPQDQLQQMQEGQQKMKDSFNNMSPETLSCLTTSLGADVVEKMKNGTFMPTQNTGEVMGKCFGQQNGSQGQMSNQNQQAQNGQGGSNNMMSGDLRECLQQLGGDILTQVQSGPLADPALMEKAKPCFEKYGQQNQQGQNQQGQQGNNFQPGPGTTNPGGQQMPQQAGPGGCKSPEECQAYCSAHPQECGAPASGTIMHQCEGSECDSWRAEGQGQSGQQPPEGTMPQNFQQPSPGTQPGQPGQYIQGQPQQGQIQPGQSGQYIQGQPQQGQMQQFQQNQPNQMQSGQPGQPGQFDQFNQLNQLNPPNQLNQINQPGQNQPMNQIQPGSQPGEQLNQPGQIQMQQPPQPQDQPQPQSQPQVQPQPQPQPPVDQQTPPPPPSSFLQQAQKFLGSVFDVFIK